ncbi:prepilin peptidase [Sedimentibacter sp. MB31-C6]|uniref:prepilin peptidase n=1 Tax=Sedimentibacter sp. MB31-C6 TaxID=3109366 RepID=UPI002DDDAABD|nr:prepilin peptidase [Sedimentibacter sp. MB36-C1]WSI05134.1 prepilin peptidase [Sedimentibacter sp. MB36-C1]
MELNKLIYLITIIILIYIGFIDFKQKIIPDKLNILISILGIINVIYDFGNIKSYLISSVSVFAFFLFLAMVTDGGIGGGDIKLLTALALIFGKDILLVLLFTYTTSIIVLIPGLFFKKLKFNSSIALGPFVAFGVLVKVIILL